VSTGANETEIKLRVDDPDEIVNRLDALGFTVAKARLFESNTIYDSPDLALKRRGHLLRLRDAGGRAVLTFKGVSSPGKHKSREELETVIEHGPTAALIFERLGFQPVFRYEKYRTEYSRGAEQGVVTVDETPIGWFLELEGEPEWIDTVAGELGYTEGDYVTVSYASLYASYREIEKLSSSNMVFQ
jgi:adenylate cyclase class 2